MKRLISSLFIVMLLATASFASNKTTETKAGEAKTTETSAITETKVSVSGTILDFENNETLAGASVTVDGKKYYSDLDGNFNISSLCPGKHRMTVELISYNPSEMELEVQNDKSLTIRLAQK